MTWEAIAGLLLVAITAAGLVGAMVSYILKKDQDANRQLIKSVEHKMNNQVSRVDALEKARLTDIERVVRLETSLLNLKDGQDRIERGQEKLKDELITVFNSRFEGVVGTIREMSERKIKGI